MGTAQDGELYHGKLITLLEEVWGDGWLSPGGPEELARLVAGVDFKDKSVLDIGCGVGGLDVALVRDHGAAYVTGIDVEDGVLAKARERIARMKLTGHIGVTKVEPGPLPFPPASFDIVFSKDSIVHIPDKHALKRDVFRVLKPGGWFVASDWLIGHEGEPSPAMQAYIESEGLDFGMASPRRYEDAMLAAGFTNISIVSRNVWYRAMAKTELERLKGPIAQRAAAVLGEEFIAHNIAIWSNMLPVLETGEHCPTHLRAQKPMAT
ncbi:MAG: methyltransferase domain-containing protein [Phyllobacteriaceae bacterium]|nr:methyltransferase domain-containing protein [Phyllobacteriaceae bacterium]